jgi:phospholipid/cholesterol/gamma-HCH transport system ATP-binding protein
MWDRKQPESEPHQDVPVADPTAAGTTAAGTAGAGTAGAGTAGAAMEVRNLRKSFGSSEVLRGLNLRLPQGAITTVLGPSGAGKSVLVKHLIGLLEPDDGEVLVDGVDIWSLSARKRSAVCSRMGVLFQDGAMFGSLDIYDNTALPLRENTKKSEEEIRAIVLEKLTLVGLADTVAKFPGELSGGMRKRAALARALVTDPRIIVLDEPDSGLDPVRVSLLNDLISSVHQAHGATYVIVTHNVATARTISDHVALIWEGQSLNQGPVEEVFALDDPFVRQFLAGDTAGPLTME